VEDPYHFVEAGAAATQNMALAAHSLGLYSCWIGVFDVTNQKKSSENNVKKILEIPENQRVIALLPVGYTREEIPKKKRKEIKQLTYQNKFGNRI
jgi:nitroreductase